MVTVRIARLFLAPSGILCCCYSSPGGRSAIIRGGARRTGLRQRVVLPDRRLMNEIDRTIWARSCASRRAGALCEVLAGLVQEIEPL